MRIVIDLDGTLCELKNEKETYEEVKPKAGAAEALQKLRAAGHYIIIHTSRHMKTCNGNVADVERRMKKITEEWLEHHSMPYDELVFGKPWGHLYIDDLAVPFESWEHVKIKLSDIFQ
jgi:capsule biosynthesis phosphatase